MRKTTMRTLPGAGAALLAGSLHAACWTTSEPVAAVTFVASQAGAPIRGTFSRYRGTLCLPTAGDAGSAMVEIDTASIDMGLPEFNAEMRGPLFFESERWPTATYAAETIEALGDDAYRFTGTLSIRDISRPLSTELTLTSSGPTLEVSGAITLNRLDFDLGTGEWADTRWVGNEVTVQLDTSLEPRP